MTNVYVVLASLVFAFFDYWLYTPSVTYSVKALYRVDQTLLQILLALVLWLYVDWTATGKFLLIWWTFSCDLLYYGFCELEVLKDHPGRGSWNIDARVGYYWAWWTPLGLYYWAHWAPLGHSRKDIAFNQNELFAQALIGLAIAFMI